MGRRRIEIKKIPSESARRTTFKKRKEGLFKKAYELSVLTGCRVSLSIIESEKGAEYVFDPTEPQPSKDTNRATESRNKSQEPVLPVEEVISTALTLPEASSSSVTAIEPSKSTTIGTPDIQSFDTLLWSFDSSMDLMPFTDCMGISAWEETWMKDCLDFAGLPQSMLAPQSAFTPPCFTDPCGLSLYSPLPYLTHDFGWLTANPIQMPSFL
ncbi:MADS-box transcription factor pvg4 [Fusarium oxysporum f. sp. cubense race 1]|uniref:MADS-box transcription factor pvg4 n=1 Tax=Fusarium oxysporum f. sp. cubense (strain race 1) TaxID=1229664 RepID=N4UKR4_FUSC1|nr:MADS-box transcription factor pvg4 [Fusarium oxysporum f. sp. cubense race 1]